MHKRRANEVARAPPARHMGMSGRIFDPTANMRFRDPLINRLDPDDEEERENFAERPRDAEVLMFEQKIDDAVPGEELRDVDELEIVSAPVRIGVRLDALSDLVPETADVLRRNRYTSALLSGIIHDWFATDDEVRANLLDAGVEFEEVDRKGRWICVPQLSMERHLFDEEQMTEVEQEQRRAEAEAAEDEDIEYTLMQLGRETAVAEEDDMEERENVENIIEDHLRVIVELKRCPERGVRIRSWRMNVM